MERLQSSRPWSEKINGSSVMGRSDYNDVFGVRPWHRTPYSRRLDDYSEIFDVAASASTVPVLDLSVVENGFENSAGVDYLAIFGSIGGGGFAASYDELIAERKSSGDCSSERRQGKEVSKYPLKTYTANDKPNLKMNPYSSFPRQSDDSSSEKSSMSPHRMSRKKIDDVISDKAHNGKLDSIPGYSSVVDASDPIQESKNKAEESECASLQEVPRNEKDNSQFYSSHQTSSGHMPLHDVPYLKVSEIGLQTKPFKGPPPSRPPPPLSMKPEHSKVSSTDSCVDFEEQRPLKSKVNNLLHSSNEASVDEPMKGCSFLLDAEMDPNSAAAVSIAAIKEAMEQAQILLTNAKKLMDRKRDKSHCKIGPPKAVCNEDDGTAYKVTVKSCSNVIDANNLLKESNMISECTFLESEEIRTGAKILLNDEDRKMLLSSYRNEQKQVSKENASKSFVERGEIGTTGKVTLSIEDRKMQLSPYIKDQQVSKEKGSESSEVTCKIVDIAEEWKTDKEYYELLTKDRFLNIFSDICSHVDEEKEKTAICSCEDKEKYSKVTEQAIEVEEKQKSMEGSVCIEKLEKNIKLKGPCLDWKEKANENYADSTMDEILLKRHACELEEYYGSFLSDEDRMQSEAHEDNNNEDHVKKLGSVVDYCLHEENIKKLLISNFDFKPWVANGYSEEKELQCAESVSGFVEYKRKFNASQVKYGVNESNKEVKVQSETFFQDIFEKKFKEPDELCTFNTTNKEEVDEEIEPCNSYENETGHMKHRYYYNADRLKIKESDNAAEKEVDEFQTKEKAHMLVKNELEQGAIHDEHGLAMPEEQEKTKNAEFEKILNSREETSCNDCSEEETKEAETALQKDEESMGALMNHDVNNSEFLASAEGVSGERVSENITEVPVLLETQISANSADEAHQLVEIDESDTRKVFLSGNEGSLLVSAPDATVISHVEKVGNHKHSLCTEVEDNKCKVNVEKERGGEPEAHLEDRDLDREKERERVRIAVERVNYETHQQVLAEARVRAERIAVERATVEARQRALAEARQKAEKAAEAEKASREARLRAERVAVERATEEARKRAIEKALAEKAAADARQRTAQVSAFNKDMLRKDNKTEHFKATHMKEDSEAKQKPSLAKMQRNAQSQNAASSANGHIYSDSHNNGGAESKLKFKERQERQQQTAERAAKALAERNMRDIVAQREQAEQAERDRLAESLNGEVRRWSSGKDGNLRALLSTLQYILGPDSGWQPIPLTDIKNASAAKKAYRRATLCVHPDKLQQRGASIQQKYICERVFDLLQEAWNKFNLEER